MAPEPCFVCGRGCSPGTLCPTCYAKVVADEKRDRRAGKVSTHTRDLLAAQPGDVVIVERGWLAGKRLRVVTVDVVNATLQLQDPDGDLIFDPREVRLKR